MRFPNLTKLQTFIYKKFKEEQKLVETLNKAIAKSETWEGMGDEKAVEKAENDLNNFRKGRVDDF